MGEKYSVLILEENDADAAFIEAELKKSASPLEISRAVSKESFEKSPLSFYPDIIIFDCGPSGCEGISSLARAKEKYPEAVNICLSGVAGEEYAVAMIKMGADDYVLKRDYAKLMPAIDRAMTARKEKADRVKIENEKYPAQEANRVKAEFLANMSHELRTPLNSVIGFSEILHDGLYGSLNAKQQEYVGFILASGRRLLTLINDILELSKIEAGKIELEPADLNVFDAVQGVMEMFVEGAARKNISVLIDENSGKNTIITADPKRFKQVLFNLIGNAVKFSKYGGSVIIAINVKTGGDIEFCVKDAGPGIKKDDMKNIFEPFSGLTKDTCSNENKSTGLGLAMAKNIVELHGGKIWVESEYGAGCSFYFDLPVKQKGK